MALGHRQVAPLYAAVLTPFSLLQAAYLRSAIAAVALLEWHSKLVSTALANSPDACATSYASGHDIVCLLSQMNS